MGPHSELVPPLISLHSLVGNKSRLGSPFSKIKYPGWQFPIEIFPEATVVSQIVRFTDSEGQSISKKIY